jgi:hypothetical protein
VVVTLSVCGMPLAASAQSACSRPWAIADRWIDNHDETEPIDQTWTPDDPLRRSTLKATRCWTPTCTTRLVSQRIQDFLSPRISVAACG